MREWSRQDRERRTHKNHREREGRPTQDRQRSVQENRRRERRRERTQDGKDQSSKGQMIWVVSKQVQVKFNLPTIRSSNLDCRKELSNKAGSKCLIGWNILLAQMLRFALHVANLGKERDCLITTRCQNWKSTLDTFHEHEGK